MYKQDILSDEELAEALQKLIASFKVGVAKGVKLEELKVAEKKRLMMNALAELNRQCESLALTHDRHGPKVRTLDVAIDLKFLRGVVLFEGHHDILIEREFKDVIDSFGCIMNHYITDNKRWIEFPGNWLEIAQEKLAEFQATWEPKK